MKIGEIKVDLLDRMGSDLSVVDAARVSFDKKSEWEISETGNNDHIAICQEGPVGYLSLSKADQKLISYLAKHNHWSPFSHCFLSFRIQAPIFVARQMQKHQVGLAWNEVSRRYVDDEPSFYVPEVWRKRADNVKQGSSDEEVDCVTVWEYEGGYGWEKHKLPPRLAANDGFEAALRLYNSLLESGICPEQARMVLPQSMMTQWHWSGSLYAFARVCKLRLDPHAQLETQLVAQQIATLAEPLFPVSWPALMSN